MNKEKRNGAYTNHGVVEYVLIRAQKKGRSLFPFFYRYIGLEFGFVIANEMIKSVS